MGLITTPNLKDPDEVYAALLAAHRGMSAPEQAALNARLILILMNQIGDAAILAEALELAKTAG